MAYDMYIGQMLMPITPSKITTTIKNQNETINLINDGEVNLLKSPGLTEISFTVLLPNQKYPFSNGSFVPIVTYLNYFEKLKNSKAPFSFIVSRSISGAITRSVRTTLPDGRRVTTTRVVSKGLFSTNMKVSLEEYAIKESRSQGFDVEVDIKLKQYKDYGTKKMIIEAPTDTAPVLVNEERPVTENPPATEENNNNNKKQSRKMPQSKNIWEGLDKVTKTATDKTGKQPTTVTKKPARKHKAIVSTPKKKSVAKLR